MNPDSFSQTLTSASQGENTSLPFIRHTLASHPIVTEGETFQTMVIGGSFYQKALMKKTGKSIELISHSDGTQPPFPTKEALMKFLEEHLEPVVSVVAVNFAYELTPVSRAGMLDGVAARGAKENTFEGLIGHVLGEEIEKHFKHNHHRTLQVSCANDTICLLLSGLMDTPWDHLAAGIVGTGLNFAIFLRENEVVNLEAAAFDGFEQSAAGKAIDAASASPGEAIMEKEVSGAYLYQHFNYLVEQGKIQCKPIASTKELDDLTVSTDTTIAKAARSVIEYSAHLAAAQIAGILQFQQRDLTFIMQGSLFWKGRNYQELVTKQVQKLAPEYTATFKRVENSDLYGAAQLVV
jgi:hexokinase